MTSHPNQEEQVRELIEVYSSIDEDGWEPDPNFVADIMGIVKQAETAACISEIEVFRLNYELESDEDEYLLRRLKELRGVESDPSLEQRDDNREDWDV